MRHATALAKIWPPERQHQVLAAVGKASAVAVGRGGDSEMERKSHSGGGHRAFLDGGVDVTTAQFGCLLADAAVNSTAGRPVRKQ